MENDADWVADVRRWYFASQHQRRAPGDAPVSPEFASELAPELGYEAAYPALQSPNWPDAPRSSERADLG